MSKIMFSYEEGAEMLSDRKEHDLLRLLYDCYDLPGFARVVKIYKEYGIKSVRKSAFMSVNGASLPDFIWKALPPNERWFNLNTIYAEIAKKRLNGEQL